MIETFNADQEMWSDVIHAVLSQEKFSLSLGDMNYVFRNMIAKFTSSVDRYHVSVGVENLIDSDPIFDNLKDQSSRLNLRKLFYGATSKSSGLGKPTMFEHSIPAAVVRDELIKARDRYILSGCSPDDFKAEVKFILSLSGRVVIVLKEEDKRLSRSRMPLEWNYFDENPENDLARYKSAYPQVCISSKYVLQRDVHICR